MTRERRRSPRIQILGQLHGHNVTLDVPVIVRDFSLGGMAVETAFPFPIGAVHDFRLTLGDGAVVDLRGQVRRSEPAADPGAAGRYVTGIEFVDDEVERADGPAAVIDKIR
jgi:hypothetical protein